MSSASQKTLCPGLPRLVVLALLVVLIVMAGCKLTVKTATRSQPAPLVRVLQKVPLIGVWSCRYRQKPCGIYELARGGRGYLLNRTVTVTMQNGQRHMTDELERARSFRWRYSRGVLVLDRKRYQIEAVGPDRLLVGGRRWFRLQEDT